MRSFKLMALILLILLCGCSSAAPASQEAAGTSVTESAEATSMRMEQLEGDVSVFDGEKDIEAFAGMGLYSGYDIGTKKESYDWIMLDNVKLLKMDQNTRTSIDQQGKKIRILLEEGSLFFCVSEPLADDEELSFETENVSLSIRGTCGIIRHYSKTSYIIMLEGEAEAECLNNVSNSFDLVQGDVLIVPELSYQTDHMVHGDLPDFVREELTDSDMVKEKMEGSSIDPDDYMNDEEVLEAAKKFEGRYLCINSYYSKGDIPGVDVLIKDPYTLEISLDENGYLKAVAKESEEAYAAVEEFNKMAEEAGAYYRMTHTDMDIDMPVIRISEDGGLLLGGYFESGLYRNENGNLTTYPGFLDAYRKID